jgi:hypothetical protein
MVRMIAQNGKLLAFRPTIGTDRRRRKSGGKKQGEK